ncbi:MAG: Gfo/Idh/MocA family protein [Terriglobia bacterium]
MSTALKGAIIGCGWYAENHRQAWLRIPEVQIVAAADLRLDRAQRFAARAYSSAEELLEREHLDFVDIATHAASHHHMVSLACVMEAADSPDRRTQTCRFSRSSRSRRCARAPDWNSVWKPTMRSITCNLQGQMRL